jgi:hypothetical protein
MKMAKPQERNKERKKDMGKCRGFQRLRFDSSNSRTIATTITIKCYLFLNFKEFYSN